MRQTRSAPDESKLYEPGIAGVPPGNVQEQKGLQPSGRTVDEFKPYSPLSPQKNIETSDAKKSQSNNLSVEGTKEEQDPQVQAQIAQLKAIELKVKAHEAAHKSAGGTMTGPVSYSYTRGPDGKNYITGGEVPISVSSGKTPQETISRMEQVIQAALAPADPSPQDRAVAAQAAAQQQAARQELATATETATIGAPPASVEPGNKGDSIVARDAQRAYGNPAVTGKQPGIPVIAGAARQEPQSAVPSLTDATQSSFAPMTPSGINGYGSTQPVSYYA
ncbi:MAG: hypothetical protein HGB32_06910 [Geobacteraceae bacterium]|nr:hypothetical protein [Geobacteraceae bacterium]NTW79864.1 hypothetical protein [Geobacteraceae bacterium]